MKFNFLKKKVPASKPESQDKPLIFPPKRRGNKLKPFFILLLIILSIGIALKILPKYTQQLSTLVKQAKGLADKEKRIEKAQEGLVTPAEEAVEEAISVRTYKTARTDFVDILPAMGTIKGDKEIELRFSINGIIDSINFYEGDIVKKGDIISTLEQKESLLKLEYAKTKLKTAEVAELSAKKKLEMHQSLYEQGIIIQSKLEEARLEYESAKTKTASAQKEIDFSLSELDKTYLYSPIDGVIGTRDAEVGEFVTSNVKVAGLYDVSYAIAEFGIIEKDINKVALGQSVKLNVDTYPGVDFTGSVDNISPIIEGKSRTLTVKARFKNDNPKGTLLPGMFAHTWISVYEKKNIIKVPADALYDLDNNGEFDSVYVIDEQNIAHARPVKLGYITTDVVEIADGLKENEQVAAEAMAPLKDGSKVEVIEVQEALF